MNVIFYFIIVEENIVFGEFQEYRDPTGYEMVDYNGF